MMLVYLAGPMVGMASAAAFTLAKRLLIERGNRVHSPMDTRLRLGYDPENPRGFDTVETALENLPWAAKADVVAVLPGGDTDEESRVDIAVAEAFGVPSRPIEALLT